MHILVFGQTGQVATELQRCAKGDIRLTALSRQEADLNTPELCAEAIAVHSPDAVINAAAYTAVDLAEDEEQLAYTINAEAPAAMAQACADRNIPFVTISTDYVFSGDGDAAWRPHDPTEPKGAYGRTKLAGEIAVAEIGGAFAILRTSWVVSAHGKNFVKTMLRLGAENAEREIVADQFGGPTGAREIAKACLEIARQLIEDPQKAGIYHFASVPDVSWADFAREIFAQANLDCVVKDIATSDFDTRADRPPNSRMDCSETERVFGIQRPDWKTSLADILHELKATKAA